ncbi:MAG: hypothetical protein IJ011_01865 [Clostridia bacterium]|nr:hypothetical protein [Clostridia bacterium]
MKKIISVLLVSFIILGALPFAVFAEEGTAATPTERDTSWYSDDLSTFNISTPAQLLGFSDLLADGKTFGGKVIKLKSDIILNEGWEAGATAPVDTWADNSGKTFGGTFDGNGHRISGIYLSAASGASAARTAIFGGYGNGATIKNLLIENSYVEGGTYLGAVFGQGYGNTTIENVYCDVYVKTLATGSGQAQVGGLIGEASGKTTSATTITNTVFAGTVDASGSAVRAIGGLIGRINNSEVTMTDCAFYGTFIGNHTGHGAIIGRTESAASKLTAEGCIAAGSFTSNATHSNQNTSYVGSFYGQVYINANWSSHNIAIDLKDCYYTEITLSKRTEGAVIYQPIPLYNGVLTPTSTSTYTNITDAELKALTADGLAAMAGLDGYVAVENGYPLPLYIDALVRGEVFEESPMADDHWYTLEVRDETPLLLVIDSAEDMLAFSECLEAGVDFADCTVELACDVDLNKGWSADGETVSAPEKPWKLVSGGKSFAGTFDGKGNTVSGIYLKPAVVTESVENEDGSVTEKEKAVDGVGIFGNVGGGMATVKNVVITNSYIESAGNSQGGIFGSVLGSAVIDGVYLDVNMLNTCSTSGSGMGGFVGLVTSGSSVRLTNSVFAGSIKTDRSRIDGGITGVGGFVGAANAADETKGSVSAVDCGFFGSLECGAHMASGFIGKVGNTSGAGELEVKLERVLIGGSLYTGDADWNGSFCGQLMSGTLTASDCYHIAFNNAGELCKRAVFGSFEGYESFEGCTLVSDMEIRGERAGEWLTSVGLTSWTATNGYPIPTAIAENVSADAVAGIGNTPNDILPPAEGDGDLSGGDNNDGSDGTADNEKDTSADVSDTDTDGTDDSSSSLSSVFTGIFITVLIIVAVVAVAVAAVVVTVIIIVKKNKKH